MVRINANKKRHKTKQNGALRILMNCFVSTTSSLVMESKAFSTFNVLSPKLIQFLNEQNFCSDFEPTVASQFLSLWLQHHQPYPPFQASQFISAKKPLHNNSSHVRLASKSILYLLSASEERIF